ncbi:MAG TPA: hypothetical protein VN658_04730 [Candidatus Acidoferrales bacterium]|nr:hypothetical protein [Candidatus Acidoferrales bacterium]
MARKKTSRKKTVGKKKPTLKKSAARKKVAAKKKPTNEAAGRKSAAKKQSPAKKRSVAKKKPAAKKVTRRRADVINPVTPSGRRGLGAASGGQSGDTQGLSRRSYDDSESVEELMEEGQYAEAEAVGGVENAPDADQGGVRTRQFPEDDVPEEYLNED